MKYLLYIILKSKKDRNKKVKKAQYKNELKLVTAINLNIDIIFKQES